MITKKIRSIILGESSKTPSSWQNLVEVLMNNPQIADACDSLLSALRLDNDNKRRKIFLITSVRPGEGKTTIAISLALTAIFAGLRVLIIDGDFRRPTLHQIMGVSPNPGIANLIMEDCGSDEVIHTVQVSRNAQAPNPLSVVVSGECPPEAFHALGMSKVRRLVTKLADDYDLVLVDSPPALAAIDPVILATAVDGVILVFNTGEVKQEDARIVKNEIERTGTPIVGVVLNRFDERVHGPSVRPYGGEYYDNRRNKS